MKIKVQDKQNGLCANCRYSTIIKSDSGAKVFCSQLPQGHRELHMAITDCNQYNFKGMPSLWDMQQTAWILESDEKKKQIGFVTNAEWRKSHKHQEVLNSDHFDD